jgi:CheY-like chemotaxis protein
MDLRMPVMNGLETTQKLKEQFPLLPVIAQTAFAMEGDRNKCLEAGCDDYITKPINAENLLAKIGQFIETNTPLVLPLPPLKIMRIFHLRWIIFRRKIINDLA